MDTTIQGNLVDIHTRTIYPVRIRIVGERIYDIEKLSYPQKRYIIPGFIDSHIHIESSLLSLSMFSIEAISHGTVATISDPHEIANVCGIEGVKYMLNSGYNCDLKFHWAIPSCVPATTFETAGGKLDLHEIKELFSLPRVVALGEMMNYPGIINQEVDVIAKCKLASSYGKVIDGHAPGLTGNDLFKYFSEGISTDHECVSLAEAKEKLGLGVKILIREGSSAKNFNALMSLIKSDTKNVMLCSDDLHTKDLLNGHINLLAKRAIQRGISIFDILDVACKNPIQHYNLSVGLLRKNDLGDFLIVDNLSDLTILETWINGRNVFSKTKFERTILVTNKVENYINKFETNLISIGDLRFSVKGNKANIIEVEEGNIYTKAREIIIDNKKELFENNNLLLKLFVKNRYQYNKLSKGIVTGFGPINGALASSIAHDSHNIIAIGNNSNDLKNAINAVINCKGGLAFSHKNVTKILPLPVAGLMSVLSARDTSELYSELTNLAYKSGCTLKSPYMTLSFLALLVIPELKLSDKGLFNSNSFEFTNLFFD
jgi:adenine deaminase